MSFHKEISFEREICDFLAAHGWFYAEADSENYCRARALLTSVVLAWVQTAQPTAWETLTKSHGANAEETLLTRLRDQLDQRGALDVLRHGVELLGLRQPLKMAEFKPALGINADILAHYAANRLRVVRQVRYSVYNKDCLDVVLFLNGVASGSAKTGMIQIADGASPSTGSGSVTLNPHGAGKQQIADRRQSVASQPFAPRFGSPEITCRH
jgi:type I restriction enzyme R subunit